MIDKEIVEYIKGRCKVLNDQMQELNIGADLQNHNPTSDMSDLSDGDVDYLVVRATSQLPEDEYDDVESIETALIILQELNEIHRRRVKVKIRSTQTSEDGKTSFR